MTRPSEKVPAEHRYAAVVCPRCRHAKGIDRMTKTTTCGRCSARLVVDELRLFHTTGDTETLRAAVGVLEAKVTGGDAGLIAAEEVAAELQRQGAAARPPPPSDADEETLIQHAASLAAGVAGMPKKVERIVSALDAAFADGFTEDQVVRAFRAAGIPEPRAEQEIRRGIVADELYEPRPGRLKRF